MPAVKLDVHAHLYPRGYLDAALRLAAASDGPVWRNTERVLARAADDERMWSPERRLEDMEAHGLGLQVLSLSIPNVYFPDRATSVALCQAANDGLIELARRHPERFRVFASLPLHFPEEALSELARLGGAPEVVGVVLGATACGRTLDAADFLPIYRELERRSLPIFLHPVAPPGIEAMGQYRLAPMAGYLFDSTLAALRLVLAGVFERCPRLELIMPHLGGVLPFMLGRIEHLYETAAECRAHISAPPGSFFRRFHYDTVCQHPAAMALVASLFGADRLLFGTDYPFWTNVERLARDVGEAGLEPGPVFSGNAARLLRLDDLWKGELDR